MPKIVTILLASLLIAGCGASVESGWKSTKEMYISYLNPPAKIDYSQTGDLNTAEEELARIMLGIDLQLDALYRYLENSDHAPSPESVQQMFIKFPWLTGFAAIETDGTVLVQEPPVPMKELDFMPLTTAETQTGRSRGIRAVVQDHPLGAEVLLAVPVYNSTDLMGYVVVYFNMQSLVRYAAEPEKIAILSPEALLWAGSEINVTALQAKDWNSLVKSTVFGREDSFVWIVRFIGRQPIIFATPVLGK